MNILHISRTMGQGGAEKVVYQICKDSNEENNMFIASTGGVLEEKLSLNNVKHIVIPDIDNKNPLLMIKTLLILLKTVRKYKIDIIHSHHRMAAFYSRIIGMLHHNIKQIYTAHNVFYNKVKLLRFSLKKSEVVAVGNAVKDNLINTYKIDENKINVIFNSIEYPKEFHSLTDDFIKNKKESDIYIGFIGRLSEQKGVDVFLKAIKELDNMSVHAVLIGDGELKEDLVKLSNDLSINNNVIFLGYRSDVFDLIKEMDFIVLPSRWEGFPLTPIETFMMNKTIIASNIDGNNEIVKDAINGLLFEKDNELDLANKIKTLISNKELIERLSNQAYADYKEKYDYKIFIKKYMDLYKNVGEK